MPKLLALLVALLLATLTLAACSTDENPDATDGSAGVTPGRTIETDAGSYTDITPDELGQMFSQKDFLLVNVHVPYEGEIEQTDLFIDYREAAAEVGQLPADKESKIVVYCRSDRMSRIAVEEWLRAGYTNLYNLDGGFVAWEAAGFALLQNR